MYVLCFMFFVCFVVVGYDRKYSLQRHLMTHLARKDRKLWQCDKCASNGSVVSYTRKSDLTRHVKKHHQS